MGNAAVHVSLVNPLVADCNIRYMGASSRRKPRNMFFNQEATYMMDVGFVTIPRQEE
jgi:hypothetical protein